MIEDNSKKSLTMKKFIDISDFTDLEDFSFYGYQPHDDEMSGCLRWDNSSDITIYGTPNWEEDGVVPFQISNNETGDFTVVGTLDLREYEGDLETQRNLYIGYLKFVISNTNNLTKNWG